MTPKDTIEKLDALHAAGLFHGLTIWPSKGGYQISLATTASNSWRTRSAATPGAGLVEILGVDDLDHDGMPMPWPCNRTRTASEPAMIAPPDVDEPELPDADAGIFD